MFLTTVGNQSLSLTVTVSVSVTVTVSVTVSVNVSVTVSVSGHPTLLSRGISQPLQLRRFAYCNYFQDNDYRFFFEHDYIVPVCVR